MGLGSNLHSPLEQLHKALGELERRLAATFFKVASIVRTPPLGGPPQGDYYNTVAQFICEDSARDILAVLQEIESLQGRTRDIHWGPRTIDLDLLFHRDQVLDSADLKLPHAEICAREFVLVPMCELSPNLMNPISQQPYADDLRRLLQRQPSTIISTHDHRR